MKLRTMLTLSLVLVASTARAQDAVSCKDAYDRSQVVRDKGELVAAHKLLEQCVVATCSQYVQKECAGWLADVEARMPSVILSAKDGAGADLVDVAVSIDGKDGPKKLDGRALDVDPGEHAFAFTGPDGKKVEQRVVVREREKGKVVAVVIGEPPPSAKPASDGSAAAPPPSGMSPLKLGGFVTGGLGVGGLVVGSIFGVVAGNDLGAPHCDAQKTCEPGAIGNAKSAATVSTIGFVAGGVLLAGGVTMILLAPSSKQSNGAASTARVMATPLVGDRTGGLSVQGAW
jgi:hypothetical protein